MEYDPEPPFDSGSPEKAPAEILNRIRKSNPSNNNKQNNKQ
jgi:hypothetical protein